MSNTITFVLPSGVLLVVDNIAYYVLFGVDSRVRLLLFKWLIIPDCLISFNQFLPNESEQRTIRSLLNAEEAVVADDDFIIKEDDSSEQLL